MQPVTTILKLMLVANDGLDQDLAAELGFSKAALSRTSSGLDRGKCLAACARHFDLSEEVLTKHVSLKAIATLGRVLP